MRLHFLGTGGYHPNERRHTACVMLPEIGVVFDAGTGFFRVQQRVQTDEVQIFLSHAHLDHVVGLTYFLVPLLTGQVKRARVYSAPQYLDAVRTHIFSQPIFPVFPALEFLPLPEQVNLPPLNKGGPGGVITHCTLNHPGKSLGYKITWPGRTLAYITDTTVDGTYTDFIRGVDTLIHECYFHDDDAEWAPKTGHSHTTQVVRLAHEAGVKRLFLMHIDPDRPEDDPIDLAKARAVFPATELAEDRMEVEI